MSPVTVEERELPHQYSVNTDWLIEQARNLPLREGVQQLIYLFGFNYNEAIELYHNVADYAIRGNTVLVVAWLHDQVEEEPIDVISESKEPPVSAT